MISGYIITELQLQSSSKKPAIVTFSPGLNVITGPSNTGKTYIYQCINYMLGGSKPPKAIKQAAFYQTVIMKIRSNGGKRYTFQSDLKGGDFLVSGDDIEFPVKLSRKHDPDRNDTVSAFLLELNNLLGRRVRMDAKGRTRTISYRDVVRFLIAREERIITEQSPVLSGQNATVTVDKNVFKLIVTGNDDSGIVEQLSTGEVKHRNGKIEMLAELISENQKELNQFAGVEEPEVRITRIIKATADLKLEHDQLKDEFQLLNQRRADLTEQLTTVANQKRYIDEILVRSGILQQQYRVDYQRLNSTIEACYLIEDNPTLEEHCPVCSTPLGVKNIEGEIQAIVIACEKELGKLDGLIREAEAAENIMKAESEGFHAQMTGLERNVMDVSDIIDRGVALRMKAIFEQIAELNGVKDNLNRAIFLKEKITSFEKQKTLIRSSIPKINKEDKFPDLSTGDVHDLSVILKGVLKAIKYPAITDVAFSETASDFVISGEARELAGKGFRAITYASFLIALQEHLVTKTYSIGPTILDSPLVTYRKAVADGEEIPIDLAMEFYRYLASNKKVDQVIIFENEEPPVEIRSSINYIVFTGNTHYGRYGFIPTEEGVQLDLLN